ncbi:hypothetical protein [Streptomyces chartreusis]
MRRPLATLLSLLGIAAATALSSPYASAAQTTDVSTLGIGRATSVRTTSDMKPIPGTDAPNTGLARPGDNIAAICHIPDNNGVQWVLTLNRNGRAGQQYANTTGFIRRDNLTLDSGTLTVNCDFFADTYDTQTAPGIVQADMKPIAGTDAPNTGLARPGDNLTVYCTLTDNNNQPWRLLINTNGHAGSQYANTAGFLPLNALQTQSYSPPCGAT